MSIDMGSSIVHWVNDQWPIPNKLIDHKGSSPPTTQLNYNVVHKGGGDANRAAAGGLGQHAGAPGQGGTTYPPLSDC